ncbi:carbamoyltransferase HypF, partial [Klebsiella pneumoniae]
CAPESLSYEGEAACRLEALAASCPGVSHPVTLPRASSCGRLFDAVACALDCAPESLSYEGEAACRLEALAASCPGVSHPVTLP